MSKIGPYSWEFVLMNADPSTKEGQLVITIRNQLTRELGGNLTPTQALLVERAAMMQLRLALLDVRMYEGRLTGYDNASYVAFSNGLRRVLIALGLETLDAPHTTLDDVVTEIAHARNEAPIILRRPTA
jgi:hypothetical protein